MYKIDSIQFFLPRPRLALLALSTVLSHLLVAKTALKTLYLNFS